MGREFNTYVKRRWLTLIREYGGMCATCGSREKLEFAHTKPTALNGRGRGKSRRLLDILKHPDCYTLLCHTCHVVQEISYQVTHVDV